MKSFWIVVTLFTTLAVQAESENKWYERLSMRGYAQFRYNRLLETNSDYTCSQCDRSIGDKQGLFLRRARLTLNGFVSDKIFFQLQPDYGQDVNAVDSSQNYFQLRDAFFDYYFDQRKTWRLRTGHTKVPYGFENLQSSGTRPTFDRSDAINTGVPNERDLGVFLMYGPGKITALLNEVNNSRFKGAGDYGMFAIGFYNGQTANRPEKNNDLHRVARVTYPWKLQSGQIMEASLQAYEGKYTTNTGQMFYEHRSAASFVIYPQPLGFQAEYNLGQGPEFDPKQNQVRTRPLKGGYAQVSYLLELEEDRFFPYVRFQDYDGGRKTFDGNHLVTRELEVGTEWQPDPALELTFAYMTGKRKSESNVAEENFNVKGQLFRIQAQVNY